METSPNHYSRILQRLYAFSPQGIHLGLEHVFLAAARLGNPERSTLCVQVAGTNGKGSVCAMLAAAAQRAGLTVGLYTSPHLHRFSERIRVNGVEVEDGLLADHLERVLSLTVGTASIPLTFFEIATLAAFSIFGEKHVDLAVIEVGLGGRLDATSICEPIVTAVTSIGLDHTALLGDTISAIAAEKLAIAQAGMPMVIGDLPEEAIVVAEQIAAMRGCPLLKQRRDFPANSGAQLPWPGEHQQKNAAIAQQIFRQIKHVFPECTDQVFLAAAPTTFWPGRFEWVRGARNYLLDGAHNVEASRALASTLKGQEIHPHTLIFGALKDKPFAQMLQCLRPFATQVLLVPPPISRAFDPSAVALTTDIVAQNAQTAMTAAQQITPQGKTILVSGSFFIVSAVRARLLNERTDPPVGL